jgi:glucose/arabinose dehydrogenase/PKD repeat protein
VGGLLASRMIRHAFAARWVLAFTLLGLAGLPGPARAALPPNFADQLVTNIGSPTALAFTPDGRLLIGTQGGALRVYQNGALLGTAAITLSPICSNSERGLLGVTVHPQFASNNFIYVYYTASISGVGCRNRVSRFTLPPGNVISPGSELVLIDRIRSTAGNHNAGDVQFGKDGLLYVSVGDGGCDYEPGGGCSSQNDAARDRHVLLGKILRITADGAIPASNPFQGPGTARCHVNGETTAGNICQETFAWGLRNPFRMAFDPNASGTRFFVNDVGGGVWEEINLGQSGVDYGWVCREGAHTNFTGGACNPTPTGMTDPIFEYQHGWSIPGTTDPGNCGAITGGAFVPNGLWPGYDGSYLFSDYNCGWVVKLTGPPYIGADFATFLGNSSVVAMIFGPHGASQALYYTTYNNGGQVRRILYNVNGNNPPEAEASADRVGGAVPLTVTFSAAGSSDPDAGNTLTYFWNFGDGSPEASTTSLTIAHTYTGGGTYTASLRARDNHFAFSPPVTLQIHAGNTPPQPVMTVPGASDTFRVGQVVQLTGTATDTEDGPLAPSRLSWTVILHHNAHTHPFLGPLTGSPVAVTCPAPEDLAATDTSYLEVRLTATDLDNLSTTVTRNFQPLKVPITIQTSPAGLTIPVNGVNKTGPSTFTSWASYTLNVDAPNQGLGGTNYGWTSWSDGGARAHAITTPLTAATYTASFQALPQLSLRYYTLPPCRLVDTRNAAGPRGGPALSAGGTRHFDLDGVCGIPSTAKALAVNVTAIQPSAAGHLRLWEQGGLMPASSVINFRAGQNRANNGFVTLSATGAVSVFCGITGSGSTHLALDVVGYFQ